MTRELASAIRKVFRAKRALAATEHHHENEHLWAIDFGHRQAQSVFGAVPGFDFLMLKKLEPMIQLNSQETTATTELHPVTTFEQGRREDRGPLNLEPLNLEPLNFERARAAAHAPSREGTADDAERRCGDTEI